MEIVLVLEELLNESVALLKLILESLAILCVAIGLVYTAWRTLTRLHDVDVSKLVLIRLTFGGWLVLALEFQLAADIVATTVAPSFEELMKLAIVAGIRTLLSYFLQREIDAVKREEDQPDNPS